MTRAADSCLQMSKSISWKGCSYSCSPHELAAGEGWVQQYPMWQDAELWISKHGATLASRLEDDILPPQAAGNDNHRSRRPEQAVCLAELPNA